MVVDYRGNLKNSKYYWYVIKKLRKYVRCGKCPESLWYEGEYIRRELEVQDGMKDMAELLGHILSQLEIIPALEVKNKYNRYKNTSNKYAEVEKQGIGFKDSAMIQLFKDYFFVVVFFTIYYAVYEYVSLFKYASILVSSILLMIGTTKLLLAMSRTAYLFLPIFRKVEMEVFSSGHLVGYDFVEKCNNTSLIDVLLKDIHERNLVWLNIMLEDSNKSTRAKNIQQCLERAQSTKEEIKALVEIELLYNE